MHLYTIQSILYCGLVQDSKEYYTGANMYKKTYRRECKTTKLSGLQSHVVLCQLEWEVYLISGSAYL